MSGFEVAGIVLGALPLLVKSLEYYIEGVCSSSKQVGLTR